MNTKEVYKLFLLPAIFLGAGLRFVPVMIAGFPINDGGMFYVMVEELKANQFVLPIFTQYNLANIPFAYPPFGFYTTALFSSLFRIPALDVVRWLPPMVSTLSLVAFYLLADEILGTKTQAALAALFYGLVPDSFGWAIMGGGITRAFGLLFMFLTIAYANRLFAHPRRLVAAQAALFGALAFLSHPQTGVHAAAGCILLWYFRGHSRKTFLWSVGVSVGVLTLSAPWWGSVIANHGFTPFQSALHSSDDGAFHLAKLLMLQFGGGPFFSLSMGIGFIGLLGVLAQRDYLLPIWLVLPFLVDPRGVGGIVLIPIAMLAAYGFDQMIAPALLSLRGRASSWLTDRFTTLTIFGIMLYLFFGASVFGISLAGEHLSAADRETIAWVDANIPHGSDFLLLTGKQYSMKDPFQEWFPALTKQRSLTTLQGAEWTLGADFFPYYGELVSLQHCTDTNCISTWRERTGLEHQYIIIIRESSSPLRASLVMLLSSVQESSGYEMIYDSGNAVIFNQKER